MLFELVRHLCEGLAHLQVCLTVQLGSLDVAQAVGLAAGQEKQVGSYEVVVLELDDVADVDLAPLLLLEVLAAQDEGGP